MQKRTGSESLTRPVSAVLLFILWATCLTGRAQAQTSAQSELLIQNGHSSGVEAIAYSPSSHVFASVSEDSTIKLWDARSGLLLANLVGHSGPVSSVAFSPDGRYIVSGSYDSTVRLWDAQGGKFIRPLVGHTSQVHTVAFSPDGLMVASGSGWYGDVSDNSVRLWDVQSGNQTHKLDGHSGQVTSLAFSPDSRSLISVSTDGTIKTWSVSAGRLVRTFENRVYYENNTKFYLNGIMYVAFGPDGRTIATVSDNSVQFRNVRDGNVFRSIGGDTSRVGSVAFSPDWSAVVIGGLFGDELRMWDTQSGNLIRSLGVPEESVSSLAFSNDGKFIVSGANDASIRIWDAGSGRLARSMESNSSNATSAVFSPDGGILAWGSGNNIKLWDLRGGRMLATLKGHKSSVNSIAFSPDGKHLASGSDEESVKVWSVSEGRVVRTVGGEDSVFAVAFSPDGQTLASGWGHEQDMAVNLWDWRSGRLLRKLPVPSQDEDEASIRPRIMKASFTPVRGVPPLVLSIAFSPDGKKVAAANIYNTADVWEARTGRWLYTLKGHNYSVTSVSFSPDSKTVISSGTNIKLWDASSGRLVNTLDRHKDYINAVTFSPDGTKIASASNDRTIKLWDVSSGTVLRSLEEHASGVNSVAFSSDGKFLASASRDTTTKLWSADTGYWAATIAPFDDDNWVAYTPDSYFTASPGASKYITWRVGDKIQDFAKHKARLDKREFVVARMRGQAQLVATEVKVGEEIKTIRTPAVSIAAAEDTLRDKWKGMRYYALVIGNGVYQSGVLGKLKTPMKDAEDVKQLLENRFGFEVEPLMNATRRQILNAIDGFKNDPKMDDNASLIIYYAGHGEYEEDTGVAYWQPVDAQPNDPSTWISADEVINRVRGMKARHVLIVADSCFSGGFFDPTLSGEFPQDEPVVYLDTMMERTSRLIMTSGGKEYVDDAGPEGHSVFTHAFLLALREQKSNIFTGEQVFTFVKRYVIYNANQVPLFGPIRASSRNNTNLGSFVFMRRR